MPFLIALIVFVHASLAWGSMLAHLASTFRRWSWLQRLGTSGVGRIADVIAIGFGILTYWMAGGFGS